MSHITPIYKDGDPTQACNYRPISLLSLLPKILVRIVHNEVLLSFILTPSYLIDSLVFIQVVPHTDVSHDWHKQLDKRVSTAVIFFDLCKAFDRVSHPPLLFYLHEIGIAALLHR